METREKYHIEPVQEIIIQLPAAPPRFRFEGRGLDVHVSRHQVAAVAESLCRLATGERRQGIIDLAMALGAEVVE